MTWYQLSIGTIDDSRAADRGEWMQVGVGTLFPSAVLSSAGTSLAPGRKEVIDHNHSNSARRDWTRIQGHASGWWRCAINNNGLSSLARRRNPRRNRPLLIVLPTPLDRGDCERSFVTIREQSVIVRSNNDVAESSPPKTKRMMMVARILGPHNKNDNNNDNACRMDRGRWHGTGRGSMVDPNARPQSVWRQQICQAAGVGCLPACLLACSLEIPSPRFADR